MRRIGVVAVVVLGLFVSWWFARDSVDATRVAEDGGSEGRAERRRDRERFDLVEPTARREETRSIAPVAATAPSPVQAAEKEVWNARLALVVVDERGRDVPVFKFVFDDERGLAVMSTRTGTQRQANWVRGDLDGEGYSGDRGFLELGLRLLAEPAWSGSVQVVAVGHDSARLDVHLENGGEWTAQVVLPHVPLEIFGLVCDSEGRGVGGVALELNSVFGPDYGPLHSPNSESAVTDDSGAFAFPITRRLSAIALIARPKNWGRVVVQARDIGPSMRIVLGPAARLSGDLREPRGGRVASARVQLRSTENGATEWIEPALVVQDGRYAFDHAPSGTVELWVWRATAPGHWTYAISVPLTLESGVELKQDVEVPEFP